MDLDLETNLKNTVSNTTINNFTNELYNNLEMGEILSYTRPIDNGEFTNENRAKINKEYEQNIFNFLNNENTLLKDTSIYEVYNIDNSNCFIKKYTKGEDTILNLSVSNTKLPKDLKVGMLLTKNNGEYTVNKDLTQELYYKMKELESSILNEQQKFLKSMRKNGELYYVKSINRRLQTMAN